MERGTPATPRTSLDRDPFFLDRLCTLVARQRAAPTPRERITLSLETVAVFLDCLDRGLSTEAQALLGQLLNEDGAAA